jgi:hypothetical protein
MIASVPNAIRGEPAANSKPTNTLDPRSPSAFALAKMPRPRLRCSRGRSSATTAFIREQEVTQRRPEPASEPRDGAQRRDRGHAVHEREHPRAERREEVAACRPRAFALHAVPYRAARELRQAERQVRGSLHRTEGSRTEPQGREVHRQDSRDHLVADVGEKRRKHDSDDSARDPTWAGARCHPAHRTRGEASNAAPPETTSSSEQPAGPDAPLRAVAFRRDR